MSWTDTAEQSLNHMRPRLLPILSVFDTDFIVAGEIVVQKLTIELLTAALE